MSTWIKAKQAWLKDLSAQYETITDDEMLQCAKEDIQTLIKELGDALHSLDVSYRYRAGMDNPLEESPI